MNEHDQNLVKWAKSLTYVEGGEINPEAAETKLGYLLLRDVMFRLEREENIRYEYHN